MKTLTLLLLPLLFCSGNNYVDTQIDVSNLGKPTQAEPPLPTPSDSEIANYYSVITETSGNALLGQVRDLTWSKHQHYTDYDDSGKKLLYYYTDYDPQNPTTKVIDFYTQVSGERTWAYPPWSREHVWAASLSNGVWARDPKPNPSEQYGGSDMHHLRICDSGINTFRNNRPYSDLNGIPNRVLEKKVVKSFDTTTLHPCGYTVEGKWLFEPLDTVKGDIARILLYQFMHYNTPQSLAKNNLTPSSTPIGNPNYVITPKNPSYPGDGDAPLTCIIKDPTKIDETYDKTKIQTHVDGTTKEYAFSTLLRWNKNDPVSQYEINRNNAVYQIQGNRNPFVDHPEYIDAIWGEGSVTPTPPGPGPDPEPEPEKTLTDIEIAKLPTSLTAIYYEDYVMDGLKINAIYSDNSKTDVTNNVTVTSVDTKKVGPQQVSVTYEGKVKTFEVFVTNVGAKSKGTATTATYSYDFITAALERCPFKNGATQTLNGVAWTAGGTMKNGGTLHYGSKNNSKGYAYGTGKNPYSELTFTTDHWANKTITSVVVNASGANDVNATIDVLVGGTAFTSSDKTITNANKAFTFTGSKQGTLVIKYTNNSSIALYLKGMDVTYEDGTIAKFTPLEQAKAWSTYFLDATSGYCAGNNASWEHFGKIVDDGVWAKLKQEYLAMSADAKQEFITHSDPLIAQAFQRYSLVVSKYSTTLDNFAEISNLNQSNIIDMKTDVTSFALSVFAIFNLIVGLTLIIKRKKRLLNK